MSYKIAGILESKEHIEPFRKQVIFELDDSYLPLYSGLNIRGINFIFSFYPYDVEVKTRWNYKFNQSNDMNDNHVEELSFFYKIDGDVISSTDFDSSQIFGLTKFINEKTDNHLLKVSTDLKEKYQLESDVKRFDAWAYSFLERFQKSKFYEELSKRYSLYERDLASKAEPFLSTRNKEDKSL